MSDRASVLVVGAGIAGLSVAWEVARRGAAVTVLRSERPRTSLVAAGMLAPMPEALVTRSLVRLGSEALRYYPGFLEALAEDSAHPTGFTRSGVLRLAATPEDAALLREEAGTYEAAGLPSQWLGTRSAREIAPGLPASIAGALFSFDEAQVQPEWILAALEEAAFRRHVETAAGEVVDIRSVPGGAEVKLRDGARLAADRVVVAAGSWSGEVGGTALPVRPVKGQLLAFSGAVGPAPIVYSGHNYLLTKADGSVLLGGTMEEAGFSLQADAEGGRLRELLPGMWPALAGVSAQTRVGLRPAAPDGLPICGPLPGMGAVYAFTAHFRNGFLLCPHGAHLAAAEILEGRPQELLATLRPRRFAAAAPVGPPA
ncbi:MAG TPA: FAD-dependent oxidoreductase [Candidatus Dormibacteraeota bacterium]